MVDCIKRVANEVIGGLKEKCNYLMKLNGTIMKLKRALKKLRGLIIRLSKEGT